MLDDGRPEVAPRVHSASSYHSHMAPDSPSSATQPVGQSSARIVHCIKLKKDLPGLEAPPWPGDLGQRVFQNVSAQAWKLWEDRQKMILNEYRLLPWQKEAQELIARQLEEFFFGENAATPPGYVPQK